MAKKTSKPSSHETTKTLSGDEVGMMQHLSQAAAAWLGGVDPRVLRDHPIPRDADGRYDAREIVKFARGRLREVALTDDEEETLLVAVDDLAAAVSTPLVDYLASLDESYGDAGLGEFVRRLIAEYRAVGGVTIPATVSPAEERKVAAEAVQSLRDARARANLHVAVVCEHCGKVRRGRRWLKTDPPANFALNKVACPSCE